MLFLGVHHRVLVSTIMLVPCIFFLLSFILISPVSSCGHVCSDPQAGPVLGGIDFVLLKEMVQNKSSLNLPIEGSEKYSASLGEYKFWFQSVDNMKKFLSLPEEYYPQLGGYCSFGLTGFDTHVDDPSGYDITLIFPSLLTTIVKNSVFASLGPVSTLRTGLNFCSPHQASRISGI